MVHLKKKDQIKMMITSILFFSIIFLMEYNSDFRLIITLEIALLSIFFVLILFFSKSYFNPFMMYLIYSGLGFLDIIFVMFGFRTTWYHHDEVIYIEAFAIMILWFLSFVIGYFCISKIHFSQKKNRKKIKVLANFKINTKVALIVTICIFFMVFYKLFKTIRNYGGIISVFTSTGSQVFSGQSYLSMFLAITGILPVLYLAQNKRKSAFVSTLIIFLCMTLTKRRSLALIYSLLPILTYYNYKVKRIKARYFTVILIPIAFYILFIGTLRGVSSGISSDISNEFLSSMASITRQVQYGENIPDMISARDSGEFSFQGFKYFFNGILTFIPRSFWPNKPIVESSSIVGQMVYTSNVAGRPVGPYGWAYFCFGYLGVIILGIINGCIVRKFYDWVKGENSLFSYLFYSLTIVKMIEIITPEAQFKTLFMLLILIMLTFASNCFSNHERREKLGKC